MKLIHLRIILSIITLGFVYRGHTQTASSGAVSTVDFSDTFGTETGPFDVNRTSATNLGGDETKSLTYKNGTRTLNQFTVGGDTYEPSPIAVSSVKLRRTSTPISGTVENIVWTQVDGPDSNGFWTNGNTADAYTLQGPRFDSSDDAFSGNNMFIGMDNIFENGGNGQGNNTSIQRLDVVYDSGINVESTMAFSIFERGGNDSFKIAPITALDGNDDPSAYGTVYTVNDNEWGGGLYEAQTLVTRSEGSDSEPHAPSALVLLKNETDDEPAEPKPQQKIHGVNIALSDLGLDAGDTVYGYSLFAADVTATGNALLDWNDSNNFSTDTGVDDSNGGLDLMAYNGVYVVIPEPGSLVLMGILLGTALLLLKRRKT